MPPRAIKGPIQIHVFVKTHKYTLALTIAPTTTMRELKALAISALAQFAQSDTDCGFPPNATVEDFEVARKIEEEGKRSRYEFLDEKTMAKDLRLMAWTRLFIGWNDDSGKPAAPVVERPSFLGEDEDEPMLQEEPLPKSEPVAASGKGKRKERDS